MPEQRPIKAILFRHDAVCRTCGGDIKAGAFGMWSPGNITWHSTCIAPKAALDEPWEESDGAFEAWMDKKVAENDQRREAERVTGGLQSRSAGESHNQTTPTAPAVPTAFTSDPKYEDAF